MVQHLRPCELDAWFAQAPQGPALVLDVREPWEVALAPLPAAGFELLALPMGSVPSRQADIPTECAIACLCHHGVRSLHVARWLAEQGWERVANISGGIDAWSQERDPLVPRY